MLPSRIVRFLTATAGLVLVPAHLALGRSEPQAPPLLVSAAASLTIAMQEIGRAFEHETGVRVDLNSASSSSLARQIVAGAPVDLFLSADVAQMDRVERAVGLLPGTRLDLLSNQLVIAVPASGGPGVDGLADLAGPAVRRIGIGDPAAVPVGVYARAYLEKIGLWPSLEAKLIPMPSVRAVLAIVESGDVDAGLVYRTDAASSESVRLAVAVPVTDGPQIVYPVAIPSGAPNPADARRFLAFLRGPTAGGVFERVGFILLGSTGSSGALGAGNRVGRLP